MSNFDDPESIDLEQPPSTGKSRGSKIGLPGSRRMKQYEHAGTDSVDVAPQFAEESIEMKEFRQMELEKSKAEMRMKRKSEAAPP